MQTWNRSICVNFVRLVDMAKPLRGIQIVLEPIYEVMRLKVSEHATQMQEGLNWHSFRPTSRPQYPIPKVKGRRCQSWRVVRVTCASTAVSTRVSRMPPRRRVSFSDSDEWCEVLRDQVIFDNTIHALSCIEFQRDLPNTTNRFCITQSSRKHIRLLDGLANFITFDKSGDVAATAMIIEPTVVTIYWVKNQPIGDIDVYRGAGAGSIKLRQTHRSGEEAMPNGSGWPCSRTHSSGINSSSKITRTLCAEYRLILAEGAQGSKRSAKTMVICGQTWTGFDVQDLQIGPRNGARDMVFSNG